MILIISDLHLGSPLFKKEEFIHELLSNDKYDSIIINGDLFDVWEEELADIVIKYKHLVDLLNKISIGKQIIYVLGNHDPEPTDIKEILPNVTVVNYFKSEDYIVLHGHQFDSQIMKHSLIARWLFKCHWVLERVGIDIQLIFRELYHSIKAKMDKKYYHDLVLNIEQEAVATYPDMKYVFLGHTHMPKVHQGITTYVNSGDWTHNCSYVEFKSSKLKDFDSAKIYSLGAG